MAKVGDRVKALAGAYAGKQGIVTEVNDDGRIEAKLDDPAPFPPQISSLLVDLVTAPDTIMIMLDSDQYRLI